MKIRLANPGDIDALCLLYQQFYDYNAEQQPAYYCSIGESGRYPENVIAKSDGDIFVAEAEDAIIGFLHVEEETTPPFPPVVPHTFACIVDLYVEPEHRKKGAGKALLEHAKTWAKDRGLEYLELFVLEENTIGRNFYEREHFMPASRTLRCSL